MAQLLLDAGASVDAAADDGFTALMEAGQGPQKLKFKLLKGGCRGLFRGVLWGS